MIRKIIKTIGVNFLLSVILAILNGILAGLFVYWTTIIIHELGHAFAGWLVRAEIKAVAFAPFLYKEGKFLVMNIKKLKSMLFSFRAPFGWVDFQFPLPDKDNKREIFLAKIKTIFIIMNGPIWQIIYLLVISKLCLNCFDSNGIYSQIEIFATAILGFVVSNFVMSFIYNGYKELIIFPILFLKEKDPDIIINILEIILYDERLTAKFYPEKSNENKIVNY
ncbi:hypothetical protein Calkr_0301 [Caldicellulosiruptor acetigenus I77R1B]|uniref:Uncharacterized protein n=2 Tax=Caldicellulosiruptor acetigenus TaxID=301953 RepID=G2PVM2_9FIRM|nr:hypothetical protein Calkr_0301 [Caldicellulosiruptor acetigenus I77R1B]AEM74622.1 hypothetical protein Calla_2058 [Caldicellulosiruptor acetigenus 6A]